MTTVADIALYSPAELRMLRNMDKKTIAEIEEYVLDAIGMDVVYDEPKEETISAIKEIKSRKHLERLDIEHFDGFVAGLWLLLRY